MKKIVSLILSFVFLFSICFADVHEKDKQNLNDFSECIQKEDFEKAKAIVETWEKEDPGCADVSVAWFNYYALLGFESVSSMGKMEDGSYGLYSDNRYDNENVHKAFDYLEEAIQKYPDRIDLLAGRCSLAANAKLDEELVSFVTFLLDRTTEKRDWKWMLNEPVGEDVKAHMEETIVSWVNDYIRSMFNRMPDTEKNLKIILDKEYEIYPNNTWVLNHLARFEMKLEKYKESISYLEKAVKIDPKDEICKGNLAYCYQMSGNKKKAKKIYNELMKSSNPDIVDFAKKGLDEMNAK